MSDLKNAFERGLQKARGIAPNYWNDAARNLARAAQMPQEVLTERVVQFHRERLESVPDLALYPELQGYRDRLEAEARGLREGGLSDETIALSQTLHFWRATRLLEETGRAIYAQPLPEKCRILYVPSSDQGALHLKNVDDPLAYWKPRSPIASDSPWPHSHPLVFDSVGNGLHMDEIPPEIFPVNVFELCREHCTTVPAAMEFLTRYNYFWRHQNLIVHDHQGNSMAFEKTACRIAVRPPNAQGINFVNGMGALDPTLRDFIRAQRQKFLDQEGQNWTDSPDGCYFTVNENKWRNMARYVAEFSTNPTFDNAKQLMEQRDASGPMCLTGQKSHPDQVTAGCTLVMDIYAMEQKTLHRRQWRGNRAAYLDNPEIVQFN